MPISQIPQNPHPIQLGHLHDQPPNIQSPDLGAMLFVSLPLQPLLVSLTDLPLRGQPLLRHPSTQNRLDEAKQLLDVRFHLGVGHVRREISVGAHLEQEVIPEVHRLVTTSSGGQGGLIRAGGLASTSTLAAARRV